MPPIILVMLGGGLGAGARFLVGQFMRDMGRPYATLAVNLAGGLFLGLLAGAASRSHVDEPVWLFAGIGVLGGFTTFSTFSLEAVDLVARGAVGDALVYILASVAGALLLFAGGLYGMQRLLAGAAA